MHTIHRDARYFSAPLTFAPERWTEIEPKNSEPKASSAQRYTADKHAFMPFGSGPYNCVGQKLAMLEMRTVAANMVRTFDIQFADGEDGSGMEKGTMDCFTLCVGTLDVKLRSRKGAEA
jgi:cytochrome P450